MATEVSSAPAAMPQLQSIQKVMALPTVEAAVEQVTALYTRVKGAHSLLEWALSTAEVGVTKAATTAAPYVASPLAGADARVAAAIDELEKRVPLVHEQPKVIVETTKQAVLARVSPHVNKVCGARAIAEQRVQSLKDLSWTKANMLLSTAYGQKAMHHVDSGATLAMQLLDHYLPEAATEAAPVEASRDPARHAVQTVGHLSSVAARRVWAILAWKVGELRHSGIELDVRRYIAALLAALQLAAATRFQQQQETNQEEKDKQENKMADPEPTNQSTLPMSQGTFPAKAKQLKASPETKSNATDGSQSN